MQSAPLVLTLQGAMRLQLFAGELDDTGARAFALYSREDAAPDDAPWTCHATGLLGASKDPGVPEDSGAQLEQWPPAGAEPVDVAGLYPKLASQGLGYGPAFQGLVEAWRKGSALYGRAVLPDRIAAEAGGYGIHPALLDAALHVLMVVGMDATDGVMLPFAWSEVTLHATGSTELRICVELPLAGASANDATAMFNLFDGTGQPVVTVGRLFFREASADQLGGFLRHASADLYGIQWEPLTVAERSVQTNGWAVVG